MKLMKIVLLISILPLTNLAMPTQAATTSNGSITATILDAYYTDADGGGVPNDVVVVVHFAIVGETLNGLHYVIDLKLPSGKTYVGLVFIITTRSEITATNFFYNSATEQGWYTTSVHATLNGNPDINASDSMVFDPPGGDNSDSSGFGVRIN